MRAMLRDGQMPEGTGRRETDALSDMLWELAEFGLVAYSKTRTRGGKPHPGTSNQGASEIDRTGRAMKEARKCLGVILGACVVIAAVMYTGYVKSYLDDDVQTTFFIKRYPTLQMEFHDPYANEGDDVPIDQLRLADRAGFADYCKYRFGITGSSTQALEKCKRGIHGYL